MKYSNSDLAHAWAHQHEESASNQGGTFFFDEETIYSYGQHFPIARLYPQKSMVLFTTDTYSNTTERHMTLARRAIGEHLTVVHVHNVEAGTTGAHERNCEEAIVTIRETLDKASRARQNKIWLLKSAIDTRDNLKKYIDAFRIGTIDISEFDDLEVDEEKADEYLKGIKEKAAQKMKDKLERWLKGENVNLGNNPPFKVRLIDGDQLETTHGIKCDAKVIPTLWVIMQKVKAGEPCALPGNVERWSPVSVTDDATLVIGCHRFPYSECKRIAGVYANEKRTN